MVFFGDSPDQESVEAPFYSIKDQKALSVVAKAQNLKISSAVETDQYEYVVFQASSKGKMQPAIWLRFNDAFLKSRQMPDSVNFGTFFRAKYMKVLLIDAQRNRDTNIDAGTVIPMGFIIDDN